MSRAHIASLVLVNWKGVFYERYRLDRHVTALEGANGAGKTTVMIAAYVALLPDMSRLRFTNVGESGATGGDRGIWGRLGEPAQPAYAVLDFTLADGARFVAGVRLRQAGEPTVELSPFAIEGLASDVPLSDLFLLRTLQSDQVVDLDEIEAGVRRAGARLELFRSAKDYFATLFARGVTPLRLAHDEDRNKWSELLRTSMTGGISRVLSSELRSFLLKQESGLGDVLGRMRANLDACGRTRSEVAEARVIERDISGVYEAGQGMFAAGYHALRLAADEARAQREQAARAQAAAVREQDALATALAECSARESSLQQQLAAARAEHVARVADAERCARAQTLERRLSELERERQGALLRRDEQRSVRDAAAAERSARRAEREQFYDAQQRAALGLANLQQGLDELHRRAHAQRQLTQQLELARALLAAPALDLEGCEAALATERTRREALLGERASAVADHDRAARSRAEAAAAREALEQLEAAIAELPEALRALGAAGPPSPTEPLERAQRLLGHLAELDAERERLPMLELTLAELRRVDERRRAAAHSAERLGVSAGPGARAAIERSSTECERRMREAELGAREAEQAIDAVQAARVALHEQRQGLELRARHWPALRGAAERLRAELASAFEPDAPESTRALAELRARVAEDALGLASRRRQLETDRDGWLRDAAELSGPGAALDPELLRLRDELGAELLIERFDDLEEAEAATLDARLGALRQALVVADPAEAARALLDQPRALSEVWLFAAGADLDRALLASGSTDVAVEELFGARVTRRAPARIGARARSVRAAELRARVEDAGAELEQLTARQRQLASQQRDLELLASQLELWNAGDPEAEGDELAQSFARLDASESAARTALRAARELLPGLRNERDALQRLAAEGALLESPDATADHAALSERIESARTLGRLSQLAAAQRTLRAHHAALAENAGDPAALAERSSAFESALQQSYRLLGALEDVRALGYAAEWHDAASTLDSQVALVPALEAQHEQARNASARAEQKLALAEEGWERATVELHASEAALEAVQAQHARLVQELAGVGPLPGGALAALELAAMSAEERAGSLGAAAVGQAAEAAERSAALEAQSHALVSELATTRERIEQASGRARAAALALAAQERMSEAPAVAWRELHDATLAAGLSPPPLQPSSIDRQDGDSEAGRDSISSPLRAALEARRASALAAEADGRRALLIDRLRRSRGGEEVAQTIEAELGPSAVLSSWLLAREWLRRRIPLQLAQDGEPLALLERLRAHLDLLESRLARQETDLRGASEDVARGIEVQVRRARGQVRRLNTQLEGVRFGSIAAIRIDMRRVERMEQILRALRDGDAQELLFQASLPIEQALDEIFRRYGGGRGGGQRLLDYREYLELAVELRRQSSDAWEPASPARLSTGEAIGVGAALMMVVLTEWERDANLLRARADIGSLRFLFLDEANRLSRDNLGVLFELCRQLDLQLLIAAPEVARAIGNTTYRLVRSVGEDGREEVIVSGRRAVTSDASSDASVTDASSDASVIEPDDSIDGPAVLEAQPAACDAHARPDAEQE